MANPVLMGADQLQQLLNAARGGSGKLTKLTEPTGDAFQVWRKNFGIAREINGWNAQRAKREAHYSIYGDAAHYVADINYEDANLTVAQLLARYEARFQPEAQGQLAESAFQMLQQKEDEGIVEYHCRGRKLFRRAYQGQNPENDRRLITKFILGLADPKVRELTYRAQPANYSAALQHASGETANSMILEATEKGTAVKVKKEVLAIGGGDGKGGGKCWFCEGDHFRRDCPLWRKAKNALLKDKKPDQNQGGNRGRGRGRGRGGRGRGRGASAGSARVAQVQGVEATEAAETEYYDDFYESDQQQGN